MGMDAAKRNLLLLQVNDALFPIGGYAHSYGLETYIQKGLIRTEEEAGAFLKNRLLYGFCYNELLSASLAMTYAAADDLQALYGLSELMLAVQAAREVREAGLRMGSRFCRTVQALEIPYETDIFLRFCAGSPEASAVPAESDPAGQRGTCAGHLKVPAAHSILYGVFCAAIGADREDALRLYTYAQTSAMVTNCVKSVPLSQTAGQRLLYRCHGLFAELFERLPKLDEEDLGRAAPGFAIRAMQHEGLYSRIYMS